MIFQIRPMCSASEAFKTEVLKKCLQKNLDQKLKFDRKKKHNVGLKNLNFEFLADGGGFNFFFQTKKFLWFPILENIPCFIFFPNPGIDIYLLLRPCTLVLLQRAQKTLRILYQLIKFFLNFG